jgi:hypothetical protein
MEDKLISVIMTEAEVKLFSEFLEQREYTGPTKRANKELKKAHELDMGYTAIGNNGGVHTKAHMDDARRAVRGVDSPKKTYVPGGNNKEALNLRISSGRPTNPSMLRDYKKSLGTVRRTVRRFSPVKGIK